MPFGESISSIAARTVSRVNETETGFRKPQDHDGAVKIETATAAAAAAMELPAVSDVFVVASLSLIKHAHLLHSCIDRPTDSSPCRGHYSDVAPRGGPVWNGS